MNDVSSNRIDVIIIEFKLYSLISQRKVIYLLWMFQVFTMIEKLSSFNIQSLQIELNNNAFSPNPARGRNLKESFSNARSPGGRNFTNNFSTISNSNMNSIELNSPMNKNYMIYPRGEVDNSYADKQYSISGLPQYVMSMSTNINLGIIQDAINSNQMNQQINSINLKNSIASRGNFRSNKRQNRNPESKNFMPQFQDSQTFSRIKPKNITESISKGMTIYNPTNDEPEPYEYKAIDSQIGSLMKRDYTVDRSQMRNNLASLIVTSGKGDAAISPNPRNARLNDSLMFKSTNSPNQTLNSVVYNAQEESKKLRLNRNVVSPSKDNRNIKLEPIDRPPSKDKSKR